MTDKQDHQGEENGEWIRVSRSRVGRAGRPKSQAGTRISSARNSTNAADTSGTGLSAAVPPNPNPGLTVADMRRHHQVYRAEWQASLCALELRRFLAARAKDLPVVTKAVCLGAGSFDPETNSWKRTAHVQVAAFIELAKALATEKGQPTPRLIIQEPALTAIDKEFCAELGLEVAETPDGFRAVDGDTLVYGIHLYVSTWYQAIGKALPAIFVGTAVHHWEEMASLSKEIHQFMDPVAKMDATYDKAPFPSRDLDFVFSNTTIYWRQPAASLDEAME